MTALIYHNGFLLAVLTSTIRAMKSVQRMENVGRLGQSSQDWKCGQYVQDDTGTIMYTPVGHSVAKRRNRSHYWYVTEQCLGDGARDSYSRCEITQDCATIEVSYQGIMPL